MVETLGFYFLDCALIFCKTDRLIHVPEKYTSCLFGTTKDLHKLIPCSMNDEYVCQVAETVEEGQKLIEDGLEYMTEMNGIRLFRKRKAFIEGRFTGKKGPWSSLV